MTLTDIVQRNDICLGYHNSHRDINNHTHY